MANQRPGRPRRGLHAVFALLLTGLFLAAAELACRRWVPDSWLLAEIGNPLLPGQVALRTVDRVEFVRQIRQRNAASPALRIDKGTTRRLLDPSPRPPGKERWFLLGSSAARGWEMPEEFWIAPRLQAAMPEAEVVGAAVPAHNSAEMLRRALLILDHHDPTGLIIFSGNNEFIGWHYPRTPRLLGLDVSGLVPILDRSRAYRTLARLFRAARARNVTKPREGAYYAKRSLIDDGFCADYPMENLEGFDRTQWQEIRDRYLDQTIAHFETAIREARARRVRVVLCTLPVNPTLSPCYFLQQPASLLPDRRDEVLRLVREGWRAMRENRREDAVQSFEQAVQRDPESALALYGLGLMHLEEKQSERGTALLMSARDHTIGYLGSIPTLNERIRALARQEGVPLADLENLFVQSFIHPADPANPNRIFDYCHPDKEGNRMIAELLLDILRGTGAGAAVAAASGT